MTRVLVFDLEKGGNIPQGELWSMLEKAQGSSCGEVTLTTYQLAPTVGGSGIEKKFYFILTTI